MDMRFLHELPLVNIIRKMNLMTEIQTLNFANISSCPLYMFYFTILKHRDLNKRLQKIDLKTNKYYD
jgi:hypothetical protein